MQKLIFFTAWITCFFCASEWFFKAGVRIYFYEMLAALFLLLAAASKAPSGTTVPAELTKYLRLKWIWVLLCAISGTVALLNPVSYTAPPLFFKAFIQLFFHTAFFTGFALYLCSLSFDARNSLGKAYLAGAVLAAAYGVFQSIIFQKTGFDPDMIFWAPFNTPFSSDMGIAKQGYGGFTRIKGWTAEPNLLGSYIISAILLVPLYMTNHRKTFITVFLLLALALVLTMSLSGIGGALIAGGVYLVLTRVSIKRIAQILALALMPALLLVFLSPAQVLNITKTKLSPEGTISGHLKIISTSWSIARAKTTGWGFGNYSSIYEHKTSVPGYNAHSTWMTHLVENGLHGFLLQAGIALFLLWSSARRKIAGKTFAAAYCGLCVAGFFYNTLDSFFANLFIILFFTSSLYEERNVAPGPRKADPA